MNKLVDTIEIPFDNRFKLCRFKSGRKNELAFLGQQVLQITHHTNLSQALKSSKCVLNDDYLIIKRSDNPVLFKELIDFFETNLDLYAPSKEELDLTINPFYGKNVNKIQELTIVYETGFWKLALTSNLELGSKLRNWLSTEVLPSIRKTGKYELKTNVTSDVLIRQTERSVQIKNSKDINTYWYERGGTEAIINYNVQNCKQVTGKTPKQVEGDPNKSAKERLRKNKPELAATMSLNDELIIQKGVQLKDLEEIDRIAPALFIELEKIGILIN